MPATYEPISTIDVTTSPTSVTFSNIPATYTDLILVGSVKVQGLSLFIRFNSDSGSNYSYAELRGATSTVSSTKSTGSTWGRFLYGNEEEFSLAISHIFDYAGSNFKTLVGSSYNNKGSAGAVAKHISTWRSTSAITSLSLHAGTTGIILGGTITLYGIKAA